MANFSILRAGLANFVATVMYRFEFGGSSLGDFIPFGNDSLVVFGSGEWMKNISVTVQDDDIPETDELFYIVLFNATGVLHSHALWTMMSAVFYCRILLLANMSHLATEKAFFHRVCFHLCCVFQS